MKKVLLSIAIACLAQVAVAQSPKWVEKAKQAVFSVITYDDQDNMLGTGNGFFISKNGVALSEFSLFKGASRAVVVNNEGKQMPVDCILGANDLYDAVKFKVAISDKNLPVLNIATTSPAVNADVFLLPYSTKKDKSCTRGKVQAVDETSQYKYYTLQLALQDKMVSCPVVNAVGEVFGLAQKAAGQDSATTCNAISATLANELKISALSLNNFALNSINIKKGLPETEEEAVNYIYMAASMLPQDKYTVLLEDFIQAYPNNVEGYVRRATNQLFLSKDEESLAKVETDLDKMEQVATNKADAYYNRAKLIYEYALSNPETTYKDWTMDKALAEDQKALGIAPQPAYKLLQGDILFAKQDYAEAYGCYDQVNKSDIASEASYYSAAKTKEMMQASYDEVLVLMDSCMARFKQPYPADAAPYLLERARMLMEAKKPRKAVQDYDAYFMAVRAQVNDVFFYLREQAAMQSKQYQRALDDIHLAIKLNPTEMTYWAELAAINIRVGRSEEALKVINGALEKEPEYAELYRLKGLAYIQQQKKKEAVECFNKAKELGDPNAEALLQKYGS